MNKEEALQDEIENLRASLKDAEHTIDITKMKAGRQRRKAEGLKVQLEESEALTRKCGERLIDVLAKLSLLET